MGNKSKLQGMAKRFSDAYDKLAAANERQRKAITALVDQNALAESALHAISNGITNSSTVAEETLKQMRLLGDEFQKVMNGDQE